jgi:Fur family transcriptional regulator, ferric uptake regulator
MSPGRTPPAASPPPAGTPGHAAEGTSPLLCDAVRDRLREGGLRWTPQRRALIAILAEADGHVTGAELVDRCRERDPATIPSTVYRTLDLLEQLGVVRHGHRPDGREEYHVLPEHEHGHLYCRACGGCWELEQPESGRIVAALEREQGFAVDLSHVTIVGRCRACRAAG